jgi:hypothetical protein
MAALTIASTGGRPVKLIVSTHADAFRRLLQGIDAVGRLA